MRRPPQPGQPVTAWRRELAASRVQLQSCSSDVRERPARALGWAAGARPFEPAQRQTVACRTPVNYNLASWGWKLKDKRLIDRKWRAQKDRRAPCAQGAAPDLGPSSTFVNCAAPSERARPRALSRRSVRLRMGPERRARPRRGAKSDPREVGQTFACPTIEGAAGRA